MLALLSTAIVAFLAGALIGILLFQHYVRWGDREDWLDGRAELETGTTDVDEWMAEELARA